ncbi:MAG: hypothetical protein K2P53_02885 [Rickettsiales bacterium]|jgi:signal recognition particle GTPase|nr:hypothetical protein [Rickettsiales bacterium]
MELGIRLSHIEESKESLQKRYNSLRSELKKEGNIADCKKKKTISYVEEMIEQADKHYNEVKYIVEELSKTDRVAKQIFRTMTSIKNYKEKIYDLCGYGNR